MQPRPADRESNAPLLGCRCDALRVKRHHATRVRVHRNEREREREKGRNLIAVSNTIQCNAVQRRTEKARQTLAALLIPGHTHIHTHPWEHHQKLETDTAHLRFRYGLETETDRGIETTSVTSSATIFCWVRSVVVVGRHSAGRQRSVGHVLLPAGSLHRRPQGGRHQVHAQPHHVRRLRRHRSSTTVRRKAQGSNRR